MSASIPVVVVTRTWREVKSVGADKDIGEHPTDAIISASPTTAHDIALCTVTSI
jgi:hypothetical protein